MYIRKCKKCGKDVEVVSKYATVVVCEECSLHPKNDFYDDDKYVHCKICGWRRERIQDHIRIKHNGVKEYLQQFPNAPLESKNYKIKRLKSDETKIKMSKSNFKRWGTEPKQKFEKGYKIKKCFYCKGEEIAKINSGKYTCTKCVEKEKQELYDKKLQMINFVICPLCLRETNDEVLARVNFISFKHLEGHRYTSKQFKQEFPDYPMKSEKLCKQHSKSLQGENHFNFGKRFESPNISKSLKKRFEDLKYKCKHCGIENTTIDENGLCSKCQDVEFGFYDDYKKVHCRICGVRSNSIASHIKNFHKMTTDDYLVLYPNAILTSDNYGDTISIKRKEIFLNNPNKFLTLIALTSYSNYRGPNWERQRVRTLKRDGNKCTQCGKEKNLHIHHKIPYNFFEGDYEKANILENLITLCGSHHKKEETKFWRALKEQGKIVYFEDRIEIDYEGRILIQYLDKEKIKEQNRLRNTVWKDTKEFIYCRVCGKKMRVLTQSHLSTHLMTMEEYREIYSDALLICLEAIELNEATNRKLRKERKNLKSLKK